MPNVQFYYKIDSAASIAYNAKTGENAAAYISVDIELNTELSDADYKTVHEIEMVDELTNQLSIQKEHVSPISKDEFETNYDADDTQIALPGVTSREDEE